MADAECKTITWTNRVAGNVANTATRVSPTDISKWDFLVLSENPSKVCNEVADAMKRGPHNDRPVKSDMTMLSDLRSCDLTKLASPEWSIVSIIELPVEPNENIKLDFPSHAKDTSTDRLMDKEAKDPTMSDCPLCVAEGTS